PALAQAPEEGGVEDGAGGDEAGHAARGLEALDLDDLVRVAHEEPRPAAEGEAAREAAPRVLLRVARDVDEALVGQLPLEELEAGGDGAVEEIGLGEGEGVVLGPRPRLSPHGEGLPRSQEVGGGEGGVDEE